MSLSQGRHCHDYEFLQKQYVRRSGTAINVFIATNLCVVVTRCSNGDAVCTMLMYCDKKQISLYLGGCNGHCIYRIVYVTIVKYYR